MKLRGFSFREQSKQEISLGLIVLALVILFQRALSLVGQNHSFC